MLKELKNFIESKGLTQKDAALILGVNKWTLNRWLKGRTKISKMAEKMLERKIR